MTTTALDEEQETALPLPSPLQCLDLEETFALEPMGNFFFSFLITVEADGESQLQREVLSLPVCILARLILNC